MTSLVRPPADGEDEIGPWRSDRVRTAKVDVAQRCAKQRPSLIVPLLKVQPFALAIPAEGFNNRIHLCVVAKLVTDQQPDPRPGRSSDRMNGTCGRVQRG